jgi:membrane fusion protein, heavy metal efflux system
MKRSNKFSVALLGLALTGCGESTTQQASAPAPSGAPGNGEYAAPGAAGIQTTVVRPTQIPDTLELPAHIEADPTRVVHVFPPAGGRIVEMKVRPWDRVEKGETLAVLESGDLSRAVAEYHKAQADAQVKEQELKRAGDLLAHHAIAEKDYQQAQADEASSQAELEATREQIRVFGMDPAHASTELRLAAPRSGIILDVGAAVGEFSNALSAPQPLCTVADLSTVWAVGDIYEKDLVGEKVGDSAEVTLNAYPGHHWSGHVSAISDAVDPSTRTLHLRVVLTNSGTTLKPAMFGAIRLVRSSGQGIVVPSSAVVHEGSMNYIFVSQGNGRYQRRTFTLGRTVGDSLEVTAGLNSGDTIVSAGPLLLRDSAGS